MGKVPLYSIPTILSCGVLKKLFTFLLWGVAVFQLYAQSTTFSPHVMVPPRLSYDAIIAIPTPIEGSMVFDTTNKVVRVFKENKWFPLAYSTQQTLSPGLLSWQGEGTESQGLVEYARDIAVDAAGDVYITGAFSGNLLFGTLGIPSSGGYDMFIAKFNGSGTCLWVQRGGGAGQDYGKDITVDAAGNVYVTGQFQGPAAFSTVNLTSSVDDFFVAKYNSAGTLQWVHKGGGKLQDAGNGIVTDARGNVYVTGFFSDTATFGNTTLTSAGSTDIFVAKYNTDGALQWINRAGGTDSDQGHAIAVDANGYVYLTGSFYGQSFFDKTGLYASFGLSDTFLAKYNSNGFFQWVLKPGWPLSGNENDIVADSKGDVYITPGSGSITIAKYSGNGATQWSHQMKENGGNTFSSSGLAVDASDNVYLTGKFSDKVTFSSTTLTSAGSSDVFVAKYSVTGALQWVKQAGGPGSDSGEGVAASPDGAVYATGQFAATATFGALRLTSTGAQDIFVVKFVD